MINKDLIIVLGGMISGI